MVDRLAELGLKFWHHRWTVILATIVVPLILLFFVTDQGDHRPTVGGWGFVLAAFLGIPVTWYLTNRIPRTPKGKVGVVVAIMCDDDKHDRQVRADFVKKLKDLLQRDLDKSHFHLIVLPPHEAERVVALAAEEAQNEPAKWRAMFMLYGTVRRREVNRQQIHLIAFEGVVRHADVPPEVRHSLQADFATVIPRQGTIGTDGDVFAFEATAEWAEVSARYIIGLAALISGFVVYSEHLFTDVERRLAAGIAGTGPLQEVERRLPLRFRELYEIWLRYLADRWRLTRDNAWLQQADEIADKLLQRAPQHPAASTIKAIATFTFQGDVVAARRILYQANLAGTVVGQYSLAFLDAFEGNLNSADKLYEDAFAAPLDDESVPIQCEEFIGIALARNPQMEQLHYCSGLINFHAKNDYEVARRDLTAFLASDVSRKYAKQRGTAEQLLAQCPALEDPAA